MEQMALRKRIVLRLVLKILWYAAILLYRFTFHWFWGFGCHLLLDFCGATFNVLFFDIYRLSLLHDEETIANNDNMLYHHRYGFRPKGAEAKRAARIRKECCGAAEVGRQYRR